MLVVKTASINLFGDSDMQFASIIIPTQILTVASLRNDMVFIDMKCLVGLFDRLDILCLVHVY